MMIYSTQVPTIYYINLLEKTKEFVRRKKQQYSKQ